MPSGWLNVPHFKQELDHSCVAARVRMVLAHHGREQTEEELRQLLGTTPAGTRAGNVMRVGQLGFEVSLRAGNLSELRAALEAGHPPLVFLQTGPLGYWTMDVFHVAVVVGIDASTVYLNDPFFDAHPQSAPLASFEQAWAATGQFAGFLRPGA
jgi:ABC-type bacteriocin/lantibiotic exporter with double-glycine peptidase domain